MPLPLHLLQSVEIPAVTQSLASGDYNPANSQWQVGYSSLLLWALGIVPFKDDFWSSSVSQPGCKFSVCQEPNPELETLVAVLTTGPVGPSDSINNLNVTRIMQSTRQDGLLLKADKPATVIDKVFLSFTGIANAWATFSSHTIQNNGGYNRWMYFLGADLSANFQVYPLDVNLTGSHYQYNYYTKSVSTWNSNNPVVLPSGQSVNGVVSFTYITTAPILSGTWSYIGEVNKFVTASQQRTVSVSQNPLSVTIQGVAGEKVTLGFVNTASSSSVTTVVCTIGSSGTSVASCNSSCSC